MTPHEVRARVAAIKELAHDPEMAHGAEDELFVDVLRAIADESAMGFVACAQEALKTTDLDFARWCA